MRRRRPDPLFLLTLLVVLGALATGLAQDLLDHRPPAVVVSVSAR